INFLPRFKNKSANVPIFCANIVTQAKSGSIFPLPLTTLYRLLKAGKKILKIWRWLAFTVIVINQISRQYGMRQLVKLYRYSIRASTAGLTISSGQETGFALLR